MSSEKFFCEWLKPKLRNLEFDEEIFGSYIMGILTSDETRNEKRQSLEDTLSGATHSNVTVVCEEIFEKWIEVQEKYMLERKKNIEDEKSNMDEKMAFIMEKQAQSVKKSTNSSQSEKKLKEAILAQYAHVSDGEENDYQDSYENGSAISSIPTNSNVSAVMNAEKELRDKAKADFEKKKSQDKLNREKQKQKQQDRKEKERKRTQKSEHRR